MSRVRRLAVVLVLNLALIAALATVGLAAHSLGAFAAAGDYLADSAAIGLSLLAIWLAGRRPTARRPDGYPRATRQAALVNAGWLLVLSALIVAGAVHRLLAGVPEVHGLPVLVVSGIAAVAMLAGVIVLGGDLDEDDGGAGDGDGDGDGDLNMRAVLLDTAADAAAAAGVAATGGIILATGGWYWLDPAVALVIAPVVGFHALRLVGKIVTALRQPTSSIRRTAGR